MGQADGHFAQGGELILVKNLAQVPGITDGPVLDAVFVVEQGSRNRDWDFLSRRRQEAGLITLDNTRGELIGIAHRLGDAPGFIDAWIECADELTQNFLRIVSQSLGSAVVIVNHAALAIGRHHNIT